MDTNNKKIITIIIVVVVVVGIVVLVVASLVFILNQNKKMAEEEQNNSVAEAVPAEEVRFQVVRVLPSGFSPEEVTIKKGMIVRFTNPTDTKVTLKWEGEKQYANEAVFEGNDIATTVFDTEGVYTFSKEDNASHVGKVVVR